MIPASFMNELFNGLAKVVSKITNKDIIVPHLIEDGDVMSGRVLRENFNAILEAFEDNK